MGNKFCKECNCLVKATELTGDMTCYKCSNPDIAEEIGEDEIKTLIQKAIDELAKAKNISPEQLKTDLVNESTISTHGTPLPKKKNDLGN